MIALTNGQITARDLLKIRPPRGRLDPLVVRVLEKIEDKKTSEDVLDLIEAQGLTIYIQELRVKLDRSVESDVTRALLATPGVLEKILEPIVTPQPTPKAPATTVELDPVVRAVRRLTGRIELMPQQFAEQLAALLKDMGANPYSGGPYSGGGASLGGDGPDPDDLGEDVGPTPEQPHDDESSLDEIVEAFSPGFTPAPSPPRSRRSRGGSPQ